MNPVIIVLAFRRPKALQRLLGSLAAADYPDDALLIISLEGGACADVVNIARNFQCDQLRVQVLQQQQRLGLREHVLICADLTETHGAVIVLEDDLIVDRYFYLYARSALQFYENDDSKAGIALYSYEYNQFANLPFVPMANGYDTYFMQIACSWGQCWTRSQWLAFKRWLSNKTHADLEKISRLPARVKGWPESSWKKYFHGYMIARDKYFVYPYQSYSTNCSDAGGEHVKDETFIHQVKLGLQEREFSKPNFAPSLSADVCYDSFMEPSGEFIWRSLGYDEEEVEIDLQGIKPVELINQKEFAVTAKASDTPLQFYQQRFKPPEMNLRFPANSSKRATWILTRTARIKAYEVTRAPLTWFSYYAGMNLKRRVVLFALLVELPRALFSKLLRALR